MTTKKENPYSGIPNPITELTLEQQFKMRLVDDYLDHPDVSREDIKTVFLALQKQNFVLGNSLTNLLEKWNTIEEDQLKSGILFGIRI